MYLESRQLQLFSSSFRSNKSLWSYSLHFKFSPILPSHFSSSFCSSSPPPPFPRYMDKRVMVKLNGGRVVEGTLRGFDPFMNLVVDEGVEVRKASERVRIGVCVSILCVCPAGWLGWPVRCVDVHFVSSSCGLKKRKMVFRMLMECLVLMRLWGDGGVKVECMK